MLHSAPITRVPVSKAELLIGEKIVVFEKGVEYTPIEFAHEVRQVDIPLVRGLRLEIAVGQSGIKNCCNEAG